MMFHRKYFKEVDRIFLKRRAVLVNKIFNTNTFIGIYIYIYKPIKLFSTFVVVKYFNTGRIQSI